MEGRLGPRRDDTREIYALSWYIRWPEHGDPEYEADPRHALEIQQSKEVNSPLVKRDMTNDGELKSALVPTIQSFTMRGAYLAQERPATCN